MLQTCEIERRDTVREKKLCEGLCWVSNNVVTMGCGSSQMSPEEMDLQLQLHSGGERLEQQNQRNGKLTRKFSLSFFLHVLLPEIKAALAYHI